ncbi:MAG: bifunctional (p)ppGpp synthetase/guanosine-3',5'-bis(diphosphate) 3'-pyrophosphohydrolase [Gammaproteobacteria bacterium]|nr:bifunctional (p)ppGpp synthetase/guanosine-3',5'-bis(diphosphate) 3'-pyrophosphohydrolase [Gammaproteobacteria bacterium]MBQ0839785.1 bifunctional (p)ppGpp synthetase/guanosine-3',5'-bis(diphosphate) 3'-pyrophosphohydrolase [Gammaproteobacteria bacterium]
MVQVREIHAAPVQGTADINFWLDKIAGKCDLDEAARESLGLAAELAMQAEKDAQLAGKSLFRGSILQMGLEIADILSDLRMDYEGLQAAILYRAVREEKLSLDTVRDTFGENVATLIGNVLRMAVISGLRSDSEQDVLGQDATQQASKVREMLVSVIDDVRVALIKLAERTCAIRMVKTAPEKKRQQVAREIFDVYAPLADRLGIGQLKWELEDLAFRYLEADEYQQIARLLDEKRIDRQQYIDTAIATIKSELDKIGKRSEVTGRAKHIYSIWRKMHRKDIGFSQVYDIRAIRVLVPTVSDCYAVLGIVHSKWRNIPNEFDDYIASPKENGYQSLHTAVIGPGRKVVEIQIRTYEMHEESELGICAHWQYKAGDSSASGDNYEGKIAWLRQVLEWHENLDDFIELESGTEQVYVFTPDGHIIDLPVGATPVDFAYRVHTQIGHRCRGAKVNGDIVSLSSTLKTGDQVEIITAKSDAPRRDWLVKSLGYLQTTRARAKVQQWFRAQNREQNIEAGQGILDREFRHLGIDLAQLDSIASKFNKHGAEGLYAAIGAGDVSSTQVIRAAQGSLKVAGRPAPSRQSNASRYADSAFYIYGVGNLLTRVARCCGPQPGDDICGYLTANHGVTVHRTDCGALLRLQAEEPRRVLQVSWGGAPEQRYPVKIQVASYDRAGLLRDLTRLVDGEGLFIATLNSVETKEGLIETEFSTEVVSMEELSNLLAKLCQIDNVVDACRLVEEVGVGER